MSHHNCLKITCAKTATYALMHFTVAIAVAYALTGSWALALAIGIVEPFVQTFAFAVHERLWVRALSAEEQAEEKVCHSGTAGEVAAAVSGTRLGTSEIA